MVHSFSGGVPSGNHGLFHRFGIEALTIESVQKYTRKTRRRDFNLYTAGRIMEGIFRSLNNLLERFHQSFFFYLLPSTSRYVSIGMYMIPFAFLAGSLPIVAFGLWCHCWNDSNARNSGDDNEILPTPKKNSPNLYGVIQVIVNPMQIYRTCVIIKLGFFKTCAIFA